jgi:O-antigen/teichoic acid export membrane protein
MFLVLFCHEIVDIMTVKTFRGSTQLIPFFVVAIMFNGLQSITAVLIHAMNKTKIEMLIHGTGICLSIWLNYTLIPLFGNMGAAITYVLAGIYIYLLTSVVVAHLLKIKLPILTNIISIAAFSVLIYPVYNFHVGSMMMTLLSKIGIYLTGMTLIIIIFYRQYRCRNMLKLSM